MSGKDVVTNLIDKHLTHVEKLGGTNHKRARPDDDEDLLADDLDLLGKRVKLSNPDAIGGSA